MPESQDAATAASAAKSLQSCPTLCDPRDGSPPGSPVPGILQARTLEWVAISFQCMKVESESEVAQSCPTLATPWTAAYQAPASIGFPRQEYWSGVPLPSPGQDAKDHHSQTANQASRYSQLVNQASRYSQSAKASHYSQSPTRLQVTANRPTRLHVTANQIVSLLFFLTFSLCLSSAPAGQRAHNHFQFGAA